MHGILPIPLNFEIKIFYTVIYRWNMHSYNDMWNHNYSVENLLFSIVSVKDLWVRQFSSQILAKHSKLCPLENFYRFILCLLMPGHRSSLPSMCNLMVLSKLNPSLYIFLPTLHRLKPAILNLRLNLQRISYLLTYFLGPQGAARLCLLI
jgi:hypothetical protein